MSKRIVFAAVLAAVVLQSAGCCWRRGCNKCNAAAPAPAPVAFYAPPPAPPCP